MRLLKRIFFYLIVPIAAFICFIVVLSAYRGHISGTEIKDEFMEGFFTPDVLHKSVKVIETSEGKRYVLVDFGRKLERKELTEYQLLLAKRGLNEYSTSLGVPMPSSLLMYIAGKSTYTSYEMLMLRETDEDGVMEISRNEINSPGQEIRSAVNFTGWLSTKVAVELAPGFGREWERWEFKPKEEVQDVDPRIGKYPGSIRVDAYQSGIIATFYVEDSNEEILEFYRKRLQKLVKLRPSLKYSEYPRKFSTATMYGLTLRPARGEVLFLKGEQFSIAITISQAYVSGKLRTLKVRESITYDEDRHFIEKAGKD